MSYDKSTTNPHDKLKLLNKQQVLYSKSHNLLSENRNNGLTLQQE